MVNMFNISASLSVSHEVCLQQRKTAPARGEIPCECTQCQLLPGIQYVSTNERRKHLKADRNRAASELLASATLVADVPAPIAEEQVPTPQNIILSPICASAASATTAVQVRDVLDEPLNTMAEPDFGQMPYNTPSPVHEQMDTM